METAIRVYVILSAGGGGFFPSTREDQRHGTELETLVNRPYQTEHVQPVGSTVSAIVLRSMAISVNRSTIDS